MDPDDRLRRIEVATDIPLTVLAILLIPIIIVPRVMDVSDNTAHLLSYCDYTIWGIFTAVFVLKLALARDRVRFLRANWFDAILVVLPMLRPLRLAKSARVLRLAWSIRIVATAVRVVGTSRTILVRNGLQYVLLTVLILVVVGGSLAVAFERDHPDASITTIPDGLWWAITTVTTVGYGDSYPVTPEGRGVGVAMMILGITLFSALTANLAAYFVERKEHDEMTELAALQMQIASLEAVIVRLELSIRESR